MNYIGEHLMPGQLGHFFAVLALCASAVATISFYFGGKEKDIVQQKSWLNIARSAFLLETISVISVIGCIYYILSSHLFEYKYAWEHSDRTLQIQYVFSCLWEGQEGSFLLWTFWHCVLGWLVIWRVKKWEAPVMTILSFAQFCLATLIIGIYFFGIKVGNSPFVLLRNDGLLDNAPVFKDINTGALRADYLSILKDGSGLNALLQNYWMVIHPPILFLGFASTIVPFAFAYAGLVTKDYSWVKASMPWALFSMAILGLGIMMGAAWAYESLTFGGYWAWDPVENASLVPWLVLVGGVHTALVYRHSGYSLKSTYLFYTIAFLLVLYETFLTRSGILGDTSVHAFTSAGMNQQLLLFLSVFVWLPVFVKANKQGRIITTGLIVIILAMSLFMSSENVVAGIWLFTLLGFVIAFGVQLNLDKNIPTIHKEENTYSREFWMFIGSLVFFLSAVLIISQTSLPVINKVFDKKLAESEDAEFSYNRIQVFIAIIIGTLTATIQYLKYKNTDRAFFVKKIWIPTLVAVIIFVLICLFGNINYDKKGYGFLGAVYIAVFAAVYSVVANASHIWSGFNGKIKKAGSAIAHVGFGLVLFGILISSSKKEILSWNTTGISTLPDTEESNKIIGKPAENSTLFRGIATDMGKYMVTYTRDTLNDENHKKYFEINFKSKDGSENFNVYPDVMHNTKGQEGFAPNPDSKHYINRDIFVYVTSWLEDKVDTTTFRSATVKPGDTTFYSNGLIILNKIDINKEGVKGVLPGETTMTLDMQVIGKNGGRYSAYPGIAIKGDSSLRSLPDTVMAQNLVLRFNRMADAGKGTFEIGIKESNNLSNYLTLKVLQFPFINILWIGVIVMVIGTLMSIAKYVRTKKEPVAIAKKPAGKKLVTRV